MSDENRVVMNGAGKRLEKIREGEPFGLDVWAGELDPEADAQVVGFGSVEGQLPDGVQIKFARFALDIAPVAADVEDIDKR